MDFFHKRCGGKLIANLTGVFCIKTKSLAISPRGASIGLLEVCQEGSGQIEVVTCSKCSEEIPVKDSESILVKCPVCRKSKPVNQMLCSDDIPAICTSCVKKLQEEEPDEDAPEVTQYFTLGQSFSGVLISDILLNKLNI